MTNGDRVHVRLLGPVELIVDGQSMPLRGPKIRALIAATALMAGRPVSTRHLHQVL
ncbi:hypothetical protein [Herbihabitans rhizosphaerae]|uniref:hypothetical protein n=1 Tax=Herbihabitans rhizosphaerae TaxID=1872711 RepID=UPI0013EEABC6|nr:hypothetical protein [Herbihabitans rhizosphaerae]